MTNRFGTRIAAADDHRDGNQQRQDQRASRGTLESTLRLLYHAPTFVLTHYQREPLVMEGGTTFHFVTGGFEEALVLAKKAAGSKDVKIGGGVATVRQYLRAGLIDSLHVATVAVLSVKENCCSMAWTFMRWGFP